METKQSVNPRTVNSETVLVENNRCLAGIIYPHRSAEYRVVAEKIADRIEFESGCRPWLRTDEEVMPGKLARLGDQYRLMPLILLGDINTNRTLVNLYSRYRCFTDADYPGADGYELRTVVNAYTRGNNVIVVGGSTPAGVSRAAGCLLEAIQRDAAAGQVQVPFLLQIEIEPGLAARLKNYPLTALDAPKPDMKAVQGYEIMRVIGNYGMMYALTGDRRYGEYSADRLRVFNAAHTDSYGDRHYFMERILHAMYWLQSGGFFSAEEVTQMDHLLLGMLYGSQNNWWRRKDAEIPLGHRHHSKGTYEFLQVSRFLKENASLSEQVGQQCNTWIDECQAFMDALCRAGIDDQDDETTLNNMANLFWYSLNQERFYFFESGHARLAAMRALALHDNMGAGAGQGGYGESMYGAQYVQQDATTAVAAAAFYDHDPELKWILENMPHVKEPLRGSIFIHTPIFMHNFSTGEHLHVEEPQELVGVQVLPVTEHQYILNSYPPNHIEPYGHFVNAPETWELAEGIGQNRLPREAGFDKLTLRESFDRMGAYLLLQGYQGGYNWQGHQQAANCIVRFSQFGKIFLLQNARQHTVFDKNGVLVSSGWDVEGLSPYARLDGAVENARRAVTVTSLPDSRGGEWRRYILWNKEKQGSFTVIDAVIPYKDGEFSLTCTWRTLGYAKVDGRVFTTRQGAYTFTIVTGEDLRSELREEPFEGASSPYVWRQFLGGPASQNEVHAFHNLFYAREFGQEDLIRIHKAAETQGVITENEQVTSRYWINPLGSVEGMGSALETDADLVWASSDSLVIAGATLLRWPNGMLRASTPFHLTVNQDGSVHLSCTDVVELTSETQSQSLLAGEFFLPGTQALLDAAWNWSRWEPAQTAKVEAETRAVLPALLETWCTPTFGQTQQRIRDVQIVCTPSPLNGFDEQLIDGVPLELREFWQQWPDAPEYRIRLKLNGNPVIDSLRLIADSYDEPLMRVFNPLPEGLRVISHSSGTTQQHPVEVIPETVPFRRYRGQLDRMAGHRVLIGRPVEEIELVIPAPASGSLALQEVEVYGSALSPVSVSHMLAEDLDGSGEPSCILITEAGDVIRLDAYGGECWRQKASGPVHFAACFDLFNDGRKFLCLGILGGELRILKPDGSLYRSVQLAHRFEKPATLFGWMETVMGLSVWRRDEAGRAALAVGSYGTVIYLDPDLNILGHTYVDGSWIYNILPVPGNAPDENEIWVRNGWNHGISVYRGLDTFAHADAYVDFGGVHQPLFRAIERVIPFHNGSTLAFEWLPDVAGGRVLAAAEFGIGLIDPRTRQWDWKFGGLPRLTACMLDSSDRQRVYTAAADGFVVALDLKNGSPVSRRWLGSPVTGLAARAGKLVAAAREGVFVLDHELNPTAFAPIPAKNLVPFGPRGVLVLSTQGGLHQLDIS